MYIYIIHDYLYFMVLDERHYRGMDGKKSFILQYFIMSIYLMGGH